MCIRDSSLFFLFLSLRILAWLITSNIIVDFVASRESSNFRETRKRREIFCGKRKKNLRSGFGGLRRKQKRGREGENVWENLATFSKFKSVPLKRNFYQIHRGWFTYENGLYFEAILPLTCARNAQLRRKLAAGGFSCCKSTRHAYTELTHARYTCRSKLNTLPLGNGERDYTVTVYFSLSLSLSPSLSIARASAPRRGG